MSSPSRRTAVTLRNTRNSAHADDKRCSLKDPDPFGPSANTFRARRVVCPTFSSTSSSPFPPPIHASEPPPPSSSAAEALCRVRACYITDCRSLPSSRRQRAGAQCASKLKCSVLYFRGRCVSLGLLCVRVGETEELGPRLDGAIVRRNAPLDVTATPRALLLPALVLTSCASVRQSSHHQHQQERAPLGRFLAFRAFTRLFPSPR